MSDKSDEKLVADSLPLRQYVKQVLTDYFASLDGASPRNLYALVLGEVEEPLLRMVMSHVNGNQCKAAEILNINRGTLRKKLKIYGML